MSASSIAEVRQRHRKISYAWGFRWALITAIMWGAAFMPAGAAWFLKPLNEIPLLMGAVIMTAFGAVFIVGFMLLWLAAAKKLREYWLTLKNFRVSSWYFAAAILGGPIAYFGMYIAMGYVGPVFSILASLMYPAVGAIASWIVHNERISKRCALGIATIILGGVALYIPDIIAEFSSGTGNWIGYLGGLMCAFGWGLEGVVAAKALDVTDADAGLAGRFTAESIYWFAIIIPLINFKFPIWNAVGQTLSNGTLMLLLLVAGIAFSWTYLSWYKSFPLVGVARGQAVASMSGFTTIVFTAIFTLALPSWHFVLAAVVIIGGAFLMITEGSDNLEVIRDTGSSG